VHASRRLAAGGRVDDEEASGRRRQQIGTVTVRTDVIVGSPSEGGYRRASWNLAETAVGQLDADEHMLRHYDQVLHGVGADSSQAELPGEVAAKTESGESILGAGGHFDAAALAAHDLQLAGSVGVHGDDEAVFEERVGAARDIALTTGRGRECAGEGGPGKEVAPASGR
jgi:hypothetical protein